MAKWRVYLAPLESENTFFPWQEITDYVDASSIGDISQEIDKDDYTIGFSKNSSVSFKIKNDTGIFSDENSLDTIFKYRRAGSRVKITYFDGDDYAICGMAICGLAVLGDESLVFEGILSGDSVGQDINTDMITLTVLGYESIFEAIEFDASIVNTTQPALTILYNIMNVAGVTSRITLDFANWTSGVNPIFDNIDDFADIDTMREAIDKIIPYLNAFITIKGSTLLVKNKQEGATVDYEFFGQASDLGIENVQNIQDYKDGTNRLYNLFRWADDAIPYKLSNSASIQRYGLKKTDEIGGKAITNTTKINSILSSYLLEYDTPKKEFNLSAPLNQALLNLFQMNKVTIDYPVPIYPAQGDIFPLWNTSSMTWGDFFWPETYFNFSISPNEYFKIIGIRISPRNNLATFKLRGV